MSVSCAFVEKANVRSCVAGPPGVMISCDGSRVPQIIKNLCGEVDVLDEAEREGCLSSCESAGPQFDNEDMIEFVMVITVAT